MINLFKKTMVSLTLVVCSLLSVNSFAGWIDQNRWIRNESKYIWIITNNGNGYGWFDYDSKHPKVCKPGSILIDGPCLLPPGKTTYIKLRSDYYDDTGTLVFMKPDLSIIKVKYVIRGDGVTMKSTNEKLINDSHGNLRIFNR